MTGPRDWDKELAEIDKLIGKPGAMPTATPAPASAPTGAADKPVVRAEIQRGQPVAQPAGPRTSEVMVAWLKVGLGVLGAGALLVWPYDRSCGVLLYGYLAGVLAVAGAGIWAMLASWRHRREAAHVVALLVLMVAVVLAAREILPRMGGFASSLTWTCSIP